MSGILGSVYLGGFSPVAFFRNRVAPSFGRFIRWLGSFFAHAQTREEQNFNLTRERLSEVRELIDRGAELSDLDREAKALPTEKLEGKNRSYQLKAEDLPQGSSLVGLSVESLYDMRAKPEGSFASSLTEGEMLNLRDYLLGGESAEDGSAVWAHQEQTGLLNQFVVDCHRQCVGHDTMAIDGMVFSKDDIAIQKLYVAESEGETYEQFLAQYVGGKIKATIGERQEWNETLQAVFTQGVDRYITRLEPLTMALLPKGMIVGANTGIRTLPRHKNIQLKRGALGQVIGASIQVKICYQVTDITRTPESRGVPVAHLDISTTFDLSFLQGPLQVENGEVDIQVIRPPDLAVEDMYSISASYRRPGASLVDRLARTLLWGANGLTGNTFEKWRLSQSVSEFSAFIDGKGEQTAEEIRGHLDRLRELYQETGLDVYRGLIIKMGRALMEKLCMDRRDAAIATDLEDAWRTQLEDHVDAEGNLKMYVRDNRTRSIGQVAIQFPQEANIRRRPQTFHSGIEHYSRDDTGGERKFFQTLKKEFDRYTDARLPTRQMAQALMTQATLISPTTPIMLEAPSQSEHSFIIDVPEKTSLDITIQDDGSVTFVIKSGHQVQDRGLREHIGTLDVGVRGEARFVNGHWQAQNIRHKFDLS